MAALALSAWVTSQGVSDWQRYPLPLTKVPSHNEYEQEAPRYSALQQGFTSIEVDPWLVEGELLVAHDDANIMLGITLELGASSCWLITREALRMMASVTAVQQYDALKHSLQKYPEEHPGLYTEWYGDGTSLTGAINV